MIFVLVFLVLVYCDFCFLRHANICEHYSFGQIGKFQNVNFYFSYASYSHNNYKFYVLDINFYQIALLGILLVSFSSISLSYLSKIFRFVPFHHSLNLLKPRSISNNRPPLKDSSISFDFVVLLYTVLLLKNHELLFFSCLFSNLEFLPSWKFLLQLSTYLHRICQFSLMLTMFISATTPFSHTLCLFTFQIFCTSVDSITVSWLPILLIILSHDIHPNPGHNFKQNFLNFMTWNVNSITKDNFQRARLIEAHNSLFNYDLISINETCINDSVVIPDVLIDNYTFVNANNSSNSRHGGVGLFYKNSLPVKVRNDISFDESIVVELKFGRKKLFYTVLYRSPAFKYSSPEFDQFLINFENLFQNIRSENPTAMFFMGDLNGHSLSWWPKGNDTLEGSKIDDLFTSLGLHQLIHEPTNFEPNKNPSCIDLIVTDQPNIVLDSGTRPSLDPLCHHQIIFCKINIRIPPPPPYERMIWHFNQANVKAIQKSITSFPWTQQLQLNSNPNWQVKIFTNTILNIMSAFVPNETKRIVPRDPPWISKPLKTLLKKKNRLFSAYKKHGYRAEDKERLDVFRSECKEAVETAKRNYITNLGNKMNDPSISSKHYWKIVNRVMNKSRQALIPPLLVANSFVINCSDKCDHFVKFFTEQCKPVINDSLLPPFCFFANKIIENMHFLLRKLWISRILGLNCTYLKV